jgi:hypothetical protein
MTSKAAGWSRCLRTYLLFMNLGSFSERKKYFSFNEGKTTTWEWHSFLLTYLYFLIGRIYFCRKHSTTMHIKLWQQHCNVLHTYKDLKTYNRAGFEPGSKRKWHSLVFIICKWKMISRIFWCRFTVSDYDNSQSLTDPT